jgi:hypothetical protein
LQSVQIIPGARSSHVNRSRAALALAALLLSLLSMLLVAPLTLAIGISGEARASLDPVLEQAPEIKLTAGPGDASIGGRFGFSVSLSSDGQTALVGAPRENGGSGAAWVFTRSGSSWIQTGIKLTIPAAASKAGACGEESTEEAGEEGEELEEGEGANQCRFGISVALSGDGNTAVIGAPRANENNGDAWIFTRSGSTWTEGPELTSPEAVTDSHFGRGVALSGDGSTVLVGAPGGQGRAWAFTRSGTSWLPPGGALAASAEENEGSFGRSVALSTDGATALIGAPGYNGSKGAAWVFTHSGSNWAEHGSKLMGSAESSASRFGASVALSGDGSTALVGARGNDARNGGAWVFADAGASWSEQGPMLTGAGEAGEEFGSGVALALDGNSALIGALGGEGVRGDAWSFTRSGATWGAAQKRLDAGRTESRGAHFGTSVALSSDAETLLVGGRSDARAGAAWVFGPTSSVEAVTPNNGPFAGGTAVTISGEHLTGAIAVRFGANEAMSFSVTSQKSITAVSPRGMGTVDVTVETPLSVSATSIFDQFTYKSRADERGREGTGGTGQEGGAGNAGGAAQSAGGSAGGGAGSPASGVLALGPSAGGACGASLLRKKVTVLSYSRALLKLLGTGTGKCSGKLRLRVKRRLAQRRYTMTTIGTALFSIASHQSAVVKVKLNAAGHALLKRGHGRLNAQLLLVTSLPLPAHAHTASVQLAQQRAHRPATKKA